MPSISAMVWFDTVVVITQNYLFTFFFIVWEERAPSFVILFSFLAIKPFATHLFVSAFSCVIIVSFGSRLGQYISESADPHHTITF